MSLVRFRLWAFCGILAQLVEHLTFNQVVRGSNPRCLIQIKIVEVFKNKHFHNFLVLTDKKAAANIAEAKFLVIHPVYNYIFPAQRSEEELVPQSIKRNTVRW